MAKNVFIVGGSGLLGVNWSLFTKVSGTIISTVNNRKVVLSGVERVNVNLTSYNEIITLLSSCVPDYVVNAAGFTDVDQCEKHSGIAFQSNVTIVQNLALACRNLGVPLIQISTDHLSDGYNSFVTEEETPCPVNCYARTKLMGEQAALETHEQSLILRTNFFCWGTSYRSSFSDKIIASLTQGKRLVLFDDVYFTPVIAEVLISVAEELVSQASWGIYNIASDNRLSKYEFGLEVAKTFELDGSLIEPSSFKCRPDLVRRPKDMSLSNHKVTKKLGKSLGTVQMHLQKLVKQRATGLERVIKTL